MNIKEWTVYSKTENTSFENCVFWIKNLFIWKLCALKVISINNLEQILIWVLSNVPHHLDCNQNGCSHVLAHMMSKILLVWINFTLLQTCPRPVFRVATVREKVLENEKIFQVREKSGNYIFSQENLKKKNEKSQGISKFSWKDAS